MEDHLREALRRATSKYPFVVLRGRLADSDALNAVAGNRSYAPSRTRRVRATDSLKRSTSTETLTPPKGADLPPLWHPHANPTAHVSSSPLAGGR